jgi:alkyl sulfatase BDS1-like metallo-beta-lactamase superfamily hydrolase
MKKTVLPIAVAILLLIALFVLTWLRVEEREVPTTRAVPSPESLESHCEEVIGEKRVISIGDRIHVAVGFDLANVILVRTDEGNVIIDAAMSPSRAEEARAALTEVAQGPVAALIFTHSHIDHVGGASAFAGPETPIWATSAFIEHFIKQYGVFREIETTRGARQFGASVALEDLPCSAIGRRVDLDAAMKVGVRMPTETFSGETSFRVGDLTFELVEAHGETHDQLFVYIPELDALFPGDNYYHAFPNLYTIRGTSPRDVHAWIASLDVMRRRDPAILVPSHTPPIEGKEAIREALVAYRDGIQYLHDSVVRDANRGLDADRIAERAALPAAVAKSPALEELYGQLDWSARAIYGNALGWFDGRPEALYPLSRRERATHLVRLAGGPERVLEHAQTAREGGEHALAVELLALLRDASDDDAIYRPELAAALRGLAATVANTNGRGYLLEAALELDGHEREEKRPEPNAELIQAIPLGVLFEVMSTRLIPGRAVDVLETVRLELGPDEPAVNLTLRNGILEVVRGEPLPDTPEPLATLTTNASTWRKLATDTMSPVEAIASGDLRVEGDLTGLLKFLQRFRRGI